VKYLYRCIERWGVASCGMKVRDGWSVRSRPANDLAPMTESWTERR
jgi:hypothetical protein